MTRTKEDMDKLDEMFDSAIAANKAAQDEFDKADRSNPYAISEAWKKLRRETHDINEKLWDEMEAMGFSRPVIQKKKAISFENFRDE